MSNSLFEGKEDLAWVVPFKAITSYKELYKEKVQKGVRSKQPTHFISNMPIGYFHGA